ncbi:hypothetical protein JCM10908_005959 [Rhodotorula pacifica]|uniref:uncharacterized protein n=1 Tax=Rhodotorula pacifica TaxID=1495444 RepID=UPI00317BCA0F
MSGYDDPYRHPREQQQQQRGRRDAHYSDSRADYGHRVDPRGYGDEAYGYAGDARDRRGGGPYSRGGGAGQRHPRGWEDDDRDYKRGRYQDEPRYHDRDREMNQRDYPPYQPYDREIQDPYGRQGHDGRYPTPPSNVYAPPGDGRERRGDSSGPTPRSKAPELEPPSASVILLGLPERVNDVSLRNFLEDMGASIDSTTVIMDRQTGLSKRFGFAKFSSVEHARSFVEPNFPSIPWRERAGPGPDDGMRIKINYSQKTGGWRDDQGASARLSEDQRTTTGAATQGFYMNDGTRDIGTTPGSILLLRGLDPLTTESEIATALTRVGGRAGQEVARGGLKKVMLVKDRASRSSWGFAFVQLADTRLATDVLASAFNPQFHPAGFRVRNSIVAASFSHENSFIPLYSPSPWSFRGDGGAQLAYWDDKGFAQPWIPPTPLDITATQLRGVPKAPRVQEEAKAEADLEAFFDSIEADLPPEAGTEPTSDTAAPSAQATHLSTPAPSVQPTAPTGSTLPAKGASAPISIKPITSLPSAVSSSASTSASTSTPASVTGAVQSVPTAKSTAPAAAAAPAPPPTAVLLDAKEKKGDLIVSRKAAPNLAKWNKKAKELRSANPAPPAPPATAATAAVTSKATPVTAPTTSQTVLFRSSTIHPAFWTEIDPVISLSRVFVSLPLWPTFSQLQQQALPRPATSSGGASTSTSASAAAAATPVPVAAFDDPEFVHGDPISFQCLLCQRQFKAIEELRKHNKLSQLHKAHPRAYIFSSTNMTNTETLAACATRKAAAAKKYAAAVVGGSADSTSSKPKYVDRAAARRVALGKSDEPQHGQNQKKRKFEGPEPPKPTPAAPNKDGLEESNAGRKMLEKMGWSAGGGLGAEGAGRVDPVQAAQFQQGAGLGSTKGVAVGSEEAPVTYADRMREKALKRYNS